MNTPFQSYAEWHAAITGPCAMTLTREYCEKRIAALQDEKAPGTKPFLDTYGPRYRDQVVTAKSMPSKFCLNTPARTADFSPSE